MFARSVLRASRITVAPRFVARRGFAASTRFNGRFFADFLSLG
jgi:hypothetical protein